LKEPEVMERKHAQFYILEKIIIVVGDVTENDITKINNNKAGRDKQHDKLLKY